jgi:hypothetical protein
MCHPLESAFLISSYLVAFNLSALGIGLATTMFVLLISIRGGEVKINVSIS